MGHTWPMIIATQRIQQAHCAVCSFFELAVQLTSELLEFSLGYNYWHN
jgi:hypothetical protein